MKSKLAALLLLLLATNHADAGVFINPTSTGPVVIYNDGGGVVTSHQTAVQRYNYENRRVEIRGSCRSACTLALAVKNVCVAPGAVLKWHHAYNPQTGIPVYSVTEEMLDMIPTKVRRVVEGHITINYNERATLDYQQLVALGIPDCSSTERRPPATFESTAPKSDKPAYADTQGLAFAKSDLGFTKAARNKKRNRAAAPALNPVEKFVRSLWAF
jgi:hypothetical protein